MVHAPDRLGPFLLQRCVAGDSRELIASLPDECIDVVVTSPPYWGQRQGLGLGNEPDPRDYLAQLVEIFARLLPKLRRQGICWINLGDAYNTPVNWRRDDRRYSSLGPDSSGLAPDNSAYTKPRARRKAFVDRAVPWLSYGNLLALPARLTTGLCDAGWLLRGEVVWRKKNPMPEGRCRRPHRQHELLLLFARAEQHRFRTRPPVGSVWELGNDQLKGRAHHSRFPLALPRQCIAAYGDSGPDVLVLDPFAGSGTVGLAAHEAGCSFLGFEIEPEQVEAANRRLFASKRKTR